MAKKPFISLLIYVITAMLLVSCYSKHTDGPPGYNVDVSRIPNAVPKREPLAKYGNMKAYSVFGRTYRPMKSSKDYDEVGVASWYGTKFHSRLTSSGERYDMLSMTAAHKTLPLPTYVEVTNLRNNRKIVVKVNDRGPFSSNRLIDLSYVAAKKLGMLGRGTTSVRVRAINLDSYDKPYTFARNSKTTFGGKETLSSRAVYFQVGAFKNKSNAQRLKDKLSNKVAAPIIISHSTNGLALYRVKVGPIKDAASAKHIATWLSDLGIKAREVM